MNRRRAILAGLLALLAVLLLLSPADVRLGGLVKAVYLHGAITWVSFIVIAVSAFGALAYLIRAKEPYLALATRALRTATVFWVVNFLIWVPLSWKTWNTIFAEPRAKASVWVMLVLGVAYVASEVLNYPKILAAVYACLGVGIWVSFAGVRKVLHPLDPIGTSESTAIKLFFLAILLVCLVISITLIKPDRKDNL